MREAVNGGPPDPAKETKDCRVQFIVNFLPSGTDARMADFNLSLFWVVQEKESAQECKKREVSRDCQTPEFKEQVLKKWEKARISWPCLQVVLLQSSQDPGKWALNDWEMQLREREKGTNPKKWRGEMVVGADGKAKEGPVWKRRWLKFSTKMWELLGKQFFFRPQAERHMASFVCGVAALAASTAATAPGATLGLHRLPESRADGSKRPSKPSGRPKEVMYSLLPGREVVNEVSLSYLSLIRTFFLFASRRTFLLHAMALHVSI